MTIYKCPYCESTYEYEEDAFECRNDCYLNELHEEGYTINTVLIEIQETPPQEVIRYVCPICGENYEFSCDAEDCLMNCYLNNTNREEIIYIYDDETETNSSRNIIKLEDLKIKNNKKRFCQMVLDDGSIKEVIIEKTYML